MASVTGTHQITFALREHGQDMERELGSELAQMAQMTARAMQRNINKRDGGDQPVAGQSALWKSVEVRKISSAEYTIRPTVGYAEFVEFGVRPGGRGLPRFFDPASANIVSWLQRTAFHGEHKPRKNSNALQNWNTELRDRYEGLAWHVRHFGVKAHPFVGPTADEMEPVVQRRLDLAVRRALAARGGAAGGDGDGAVA